MGLNGLNLAKNLNGLKKKFGWARFGPKRLNGACGAGLGFEKKNPINNQARFGTWVLARRSGPGMQKSGPLPFLKITSIIFCRYVELIIRIED